MTCGDCGRDYYPKQAWIHEPCRYTRDVTPNHVPPEKREEVVVNTEDVNAAVNTLDVSESRKAYMREYMRQRRAKG